MADYDKKYRLKAISARTDGSGAVDHDIEAISSLTGEDNWTVIPGRHKTVSVPGQDLIDALATGTNAQKATAYKNLLAENLNVQPSPVTGWSLDSLELLLDRNDVATQAAADANAFVLVVKPSGLPVEFNM